MNCPVDNKTGHTQLPAIRHAICAKAVGVSNHRIRLVHRGEPPAVKCPVTSRGICEITWAHTPTLFSGEVRRLLGRKLVYETESSTGQFSVQEQINKGPT